ncbi:MAG: histidinol-phosphate transaminase [bacterium]|nr:histidinol-phosphate transaminase [bacterium]
MEHLINPYLLELMPYKAGRLIEDIQREYNLEKVVKLASNENPLPLPPRVVAAITAEISQINRYPDFSVLRLTQRLAETNGVDKENVLVGAGSVELIRMIIRALLKPGQTVLTSEKTFLLYKIATTEVAGKASFIEAPMGDDYTFDLDAMNRLIDHKTKIIFLTNPNNPTGTMLPKQAVLDFINHVPEDKIIVMDNAYHEYVSDPGNYADGISEAVNRKNIIVLRTFSKAYALAGLRVGYAISNSEMISFLNRVKAPFNVTQIAESAALASLESDDFLQKSITLNRENRQKVFNQLNDLGLRVIPSETNFLLFFPNRDTRELNQQLLEQGVIIRPLHAFGLPEGMRVTIGYEEDNEFFIEKLKKVL